MDVLSEVGRSFSATLLELMLSRHKRRENKRHLRIMKRPTAAVFYVFHLFFAEGKTSV